MFRPKNARSPAARAAATSARPRRRPLGGVTAVGRRAGLAWNPRLNLLEAPPELLEKYLADEAKLR